MRATGFFAGLASLPALHTSGCRRTPEDHAWEDRNPCWGWNPGNPPELCIGSFESILSQTPPSRSLPEFTLMQSNQVLRPHPKAIPATGGRKVSSEPGVRTRPSVALDFNQRSVPLKSRDFSLAICFNRETGYFNRSGDFAVKRTISLFVLAVSPVFVCAAQQPESATPHSSSTAAVPQSSNAASSYDRHHQRHHRSKHRHHRRKASSHPKNH